MKRTYRLILAGLILALTILACRRATPDEVRFYTPTPTQVLAATPFATVVIVITAQPSSSDTNFYVITGGNWNCRGTPGGRVIAYASAGQVVEVLARHGKWVRVDLAGQQCWLRKDALK